MSNTYFPDYMPDRYWAKTYPYWSSDLDLGDIVSFIAFLCRVATFEAQIVRTLAKTTFLCRMATFETQIVRILAKKAFITRLMKAKVER